MSIKPSPIAALAFALLLLAPAAPAETTAPITVVSYNIQAGLAVKPRNPARTISAIADYLEREKADVVLLQEVDHLTSRSGRIAGAELLAGELGFHHAFAPAFDFDGGSYGVAIASRWPILTSQTVQLYKPDYSLTRPDLPDYYSEQRIALMVSVDTPGKPLHLITTHLGLTPEQRLNQVGQLGRLADIPDGPLVLGGDLNAEPTEPELEPLRRADRKLTDAWQAEGTGDGFTHPSDAPAKRIDYLLVRDATVTSARVGQTTLSDHLPLFAVIEPN